MNLYRFSPIKDGMQLLEAIEHLHFSCFKLCKQSLNKYLPIAGNVGIFCHYDKEYERLTRLRKEITEGSDNPDQKYFRLREPIVISAKNGVPEATYTHLYIRKPDPYRSHVGDIDFVIDENSYIELKKSLQGEIVMKGARIFPRADLDMIELYDPDVDALGYVSPEEMTKKARVKVNLNK